MALWIEIHSAAPRFLLLLSTLVERKRGSPSEEVEEAETSSEPLEEAGRLHWLSTAQLV